MSSCPQVSGLTLPSGGDVVLGQEYTDFDKGLDDGVEGEVFGFHLFRTATPRTERPEEHQFDEELQRQLLRTRPADDDGGDAALWRRSPASRRRSGEAPAASAARLRRQYRLGWPPGWPGPVRHGPAKDYSRIVPPRIQRLYAACEDHLAAEDQAEAVIAWPSTPVRVFGGAMISNVQGGCGDF